MHKLNRPEEEPVVLSIARRKNLQKWDDLFREGLNKADIQEKLYQMQEGRCAYCERMLVDGKIHIEHFRKRNQYPELCFKWSNLFLSCKDKNTCGSYKDTHTVDINRVIDPCLEDPEHFLAFDIQGNIFPRTNLNSVEQEKAQNTIDAFNLNEIALKRKRKNFLDSITPFIKSTEDLDLIVPFMKNRPFITCVYQVFKIPYTFNVNTAEEPNSNG